MSSLTSSAVRDTKNGAHLRSLCDDDEGGGDGDRDAAHDLAAATAPASSTTSSQPPSATVGLLAEEAVAHGARARAPSPSRAVGSRSSAVVAEEGEVGRRRPDF